jgi:hypothetical protein
MPKLNDHFPISVNSQHPPSTTQNKSPSAKTDYLVPCCPWTSSQEEIKIHCNLSYILPRKLHEPINFISEEYLSKYLHG